jgi:hypothetical protein
MLPKSFVGEFWIKLLFEVVAVDAGATRVVRMRRGESPAWTLTKRGALLQWQHADWMPTGARGEIKRVRHGPANIAYRMWRAPDLARHILNFCADALPCGLFECALMAAHKAPQFSSQDRFKLLALLYKIGPLGGTHPEVLTDPQVRKVLGKGEMDEKMQRLRDHAFRVHALVSVEAQPFGNTIGVSDW